MRNMVAGLNFLHDRLTKKKTLFISKKNHFFLNLLPNLARLRRPLPKRTSVAGSGIESGTNIHVAPAGTAKPIVNTIIVININKPFLFIIIPLFYERQPTPAARSPSIPQ